MNDIPTADNPAPYDEVVDPETGEILELPPGPDALAMIVAKRVTAATQEKAWAQHRKFLDSLIIERQKDDKTAVYGDTRTTVVFGDYEVQDLPAMCEWIIGAGLVRSDLEALTSAAKGFDLATLPPWLSIPLRGFVSRRARAPYVRCDPVRRLAQTPEGVAP